MANEEIIGKKVMAEPPSHPPTNVDTDSRLYNNIVEAGICGKLDTGSLEAFTTLSSDRNLMYDAIDKMGEDSVIASVLEAYAEDSTAKNQNGRIVWAESTDVNAAKEVNYLLQAMQVDKYAYKWIHQLIKYGDLYLRRYRQSEYEVQSICDDKKTLNEQVNIIAYSKDDHFVDYVESVDNPAEMFELVKFGKTQGFIQAPSYTANSTSKPYVPNQLNQFSFNRSDVNIYGPDQFVHIALEGNTSRTPEKVQLFTSKTDNNNATVDDTYSVRKGQSILCNVFKIWRETKLLETSILLNRITKSATLKVVNVEVGDMPKEQVNPYLMRIKNMIEQKSALSKNDYLTEYTNPGPIDNTIYLAKRGDIGSVTTTEMGGNPEVSQPYDLEYYRDSLFGALRVPKQFFGYTGDSAGFDGGQSLVEYSSRYGKTIIRIQNVFTTGIADLINLQLIDKGLDRYIGKFTINMVSPVTKEEISKKDLVAGEVTNARDIVDVIANAGDDLATLKMLKSLLANATEGSDIISIIQEKIDAIESKEAIDAKEAEEQAFEEPAKEDQEDFNDVFQESLTENSESMLPTPGEVGIEPDEKYVDSEEAE